MSLAEPGSHWPHCPELQCPKPIPAPVPWALHHPMPRADTPALAALASTSPWYAVTGARRHLAWEQDRAQGAHLRQRLGAPSLLLKGSRQKQHSCTHFPYLLSWRWAPRGLGCSFQLGPGPFLANHPACCRPAFLQHQQSLALHPFPAYPKLCGYTCSAPCLTWGTPHLSASASCQPLTPACLVSCPPSPLPLSPTVTQPRCLQTDAAAPAPLVWVRMTRLLSPGGSPLPAGTETSTAVSPPIPAENHT